MNRRMNRAFLEILSAYLAGRTDVESDRRFKTEVEEMGGDGVRTGLERLFSRWQSLPKEQRMSLAGVEEIDMALRLSADDLAAALASSAPLPTVVPGIRSRSFDRDFRPSLEDIVLSGGGSVINMPSADEPRFGPVLEPLRRLQHLRSEGFTIMSLPCTGTPVARYRVDWAGVYCQKETTWDRGTSHDEVYVVFTTLQPFRTPWTRVSNVEGDWDSGDDWGPFPPMSVFGETGPEPPAETAIVATVMERDFGDPNQYRDEIHAIAVAAQAAAAAEGVPIPDVAVKIATDLINHLLSTGDDIIGTSSVVLDPMMMVWLAQQPLTHFKIQLNYHLMSCHEGGGAKYWVFYRVVKATDGPEFQWTQIGGPAQALFAGGAGLFAASPTDGAIYRFEGTANLWTKVGNEGAEFAVTFHDLFGLTPDRLRVNRMISPDKWEQVGGPASHLIGGGQHLYAQEPGINGAVHQYDGSPMKWTTVGGPGSQFVANNLTLYGLGPNRDYVAEYLGSPGQWRTIGGPASKLVAGGPFLFALAPNGDSIYRYEGEPFKWTRIGGAGHSFAACDAGLFGLTPEKTAVNWHVGPPDQWLRVGGAAGSIAAGGSHLYATSPTFQGVWMLS